MTIGELNRLDAHALREALGRCCGATAWVEKMLGIFPVESKAILLGEAEKIWDDSEEADWREAFGHHPRIGDLDSLKKKFALTGQWAAGEQSGVKAASDAVLKKLAKGNEEYERRYGYIFIVCATGKSAREMLDLLEGRLANTPEAEIRIAAEEQNKITRLRLEKLLS